MCDCESFCSETEKALQFALLNAPSNIRNLLESHFDEISAGLIASLPEQAQIVGGERT